MDERCRRYAIRKTVLGVGSVVIGSFLLTAQVEASEIDGGSSDDVVEDALGNDEADDASIEQGLTIDINDDVDEPVYIDLDNGVDEVVSDEIASDEITSDGTEEAVAQTQPLDDETEELDDDESVLLADVSKERQEELEVLSQEAELNDSKTSVLANEEVEDAEVIVEYEPIPFETKYLWYPELAPGEDIVVGGHGYDGEMKITTIRSKNGEPRVEKEVVKRPRNQEVWTGDQMVVSDYVPKDGYHFANIISFETTPFETIYRETENLPEGLEYEVQTGWDGIAQTSRYMIPDFLDDDLGYTEFYDKRFVVREAQNRIVEVGVGEGLETTIEYEPIPFNNLFVSDSLQRISLYEYEISALGEVGEMKVTTIHGSEPRIVREVVKEPVDQMVELDPIMFFDSFPQKSGYTHLDFWFEMSGQFETIYRENPNLPQGEEREIQAGYNQVDRIPYFQLAQSMRYYGFPVDLDGEQVKALDAPDILRGEPERVREVQDRIVEVGTGENLETTVEHQTIPFETEYRHNSDLEPGEEREVYPGKDGVLKVTTVYQKVVVEDENDPDYYPDGIVRVEEEIIEESVNRVVEIGDEWPKIIAGDNYVFVDLLGYETIPFETIVRENSKLPEGEEREIQKGWNGVNVIALFREDSLDDLNDPDTYTETFVIREAQNRIIEVGTGIVGEDVVVVTKEIPVPEPIRQEDPSLPEGYERVGQKGAPGLVEITTTTPTLNGEPSGDSVVIRQVIQEAKPEIIYVGTKRWSEGSFEYEPIPFETEVRENPNLLEGEERVIQEGKEGRMRVLVVPPEVIEIPDEGQPDVEPTIIRRVDYEPVTHIVEVGTGENLNVTVTYEPIPFKTYYEQVPDLEPGEERIVQVGVDGEMKITTIEPIDVPEGSGLETRVEKEVIKEPVDLYIEVGDSIRPADPVLAGYELTMFEWESVPVETVYRETSELPKGVEREVQAGLTGIIRIAVFKRVEPPAVPEEPEEPFYEEDNEFLFDSNYVWVAQGNDFEEPEFVRVPEVIREMQVRIIEVGTGIVGEDVTTETKEVPAPTEPVIKENPDLPEGERRVVQEVEPGEVEVTTKVPTLDGEPTGEDPIVTEVVTKEPKPEIIEVGTGVVGEDVIVKNEELPAPEEPVYKENPNLPEGEERVVQEATPGEVEVTTKVPTLNGEPTGEDPIVVETVITEPRPEIIEVGTGENLKITIEYEPIPFDTIYEYESDLEPGEELEAFPGSEGELKITTIEPIVIPEGSGLETRVEREVIKEPVSRVVHIGEERPVSPVLDGYKFIDWEWETTPFETIYRETSELPKGVEREVQAGLNGIARIAVFAPVLDDPRPELPPGEVWEDADIGYNPERPVGVDPDDYVRLEPVLVREVQHRIIEVGTGIVGENVTTEVKELPALEPEVRENINLPKGKERVVQEGVPGKVEIVTKVPTLDGKPTGEDPIVIETVVEEPVREIIEVGTGVVGEDVTTETKEVPAPTEPIYKENPNLPEGEERVVQEATPGEVEVTTKVPTLNGEPTGEDPVVTEVVTKEPEPEIIEVGTGVVGEDVTTETKEIPAPTEPIIKDNPNLPEGEERVVQEATPGEVEVTTKVPTLNGEPTGADPVVTEVVTKEPKPEIIEVGTGIVGEDVTVETKEIPAPTEPVYKENPGLPEGEERVVQEAEPGEVEVTTKVPTLNGESTGEDPVVTEVVTKEPKPEIIEVGTGVVGEDVTTETKEVPAPTEPVYKNNPGLPEGEERVVQEATPGEVEVTTKIPTLNGEPTGKEPIVTEVVTKEPKPEIIEVGTGVVGEDVTTETKEIPAPSEPVYKENPNLPEGEERVVQEATPGEVEVTTKVPTLNGEPTGEDPIVTEVVTKEPKPKVIEVGTGVVGEDITTETKEVPAPTEPIYKDNPNLPEGEERIVQEATPGEVEVTTKVPTLNGEPTGEEPVVTEVVTKEPKPEIIEVGTGVVGEDVATETKEIPAPEEPVYKENPNLPEGEERVVQEAIPGEVEVTTKVPTLNGEPTGEEPIVTEVVTREPKPEIIEIGTGVVGEDISAETKEVPAPTEPIIKENPNLPEGEERVVQEATPGEVEVTTKVPTLNGEPTGEDPIVVETVIKESKPEIIEIGTGVVGEDVSTETKEVPAPTEPIIKENSNLPEGEERVVQEATPGEVEVTTKVPTLNGEPTGEDPIIVETVIKEPKPEIIEVGAGIIGEDVTVENKEVPAPTEPIIKENPNLPEGEERVVQEATPGEVEVTTKVPTLNGEPTGEDPIVTETVIEEPKPKVVEVGTGVVGEDITIETKEVSAPEEPVYKNNPDLPEGEERVVQEATPGEVEVTTKVPTLNGEPTGEDPVVTEIVTKEPKPEIIEVGTGVVGEDITAETKEVPAPTEPIIKENPNLPEGEERVVQEATPGEVEVTTKVPTLNGEPTGEDPVVTEVVTKEPKPEVIEVGTGVVGEDVTTETKEVPAPTEPVYKENPNLPEGEERVVQEVTPGEVEVTTKVPTLNGEPTGEDPVVTEVVIKEPKPKVIEVGTGVVGEDVTTETKEVPAPTEPVYKENPNLPEGEECVVQEAEPGEVEVTTKVPTLNSEPTGEDPIVTEVVTKEPQPEIIEVGTGVVGEDISTEEKEVPAPTEPVYKENPDLPEGEERVVQEATPGEVEVTTKVPTLNGEPTGEEPIIIKTVIKKPQPEIIEVGTGVVKETSRTEIGSTPPPAEPVYRNNPNLPEGEERVVQEAQPGVVEIITKVPTLNGEPVGESVVIEKVIQEAQPEIIEVGTRVVSEDLTNDDDDKEEGYVGEWTQPGDRVSAEWELPSSPLLVEASEELNDGSDDELNTSGVSDGLLFTRSQDSGDGASADSALPSTGEVASSLLVALGSVGLGGAAEVLRRRRKKK